MPDAAQITSSPAALVTAVQLSALFEGSMITSLAATGWIQASGEDRVRWLNGMVTNSVVALAPGDGCYNFLLNAQGRIQGTAWVFAVPERLLLETDSAQVAPMLALLDRFIIMDDVELTNISAELAGLLVAGPTAASALEQCGLLAATLAVRPGAHLQELTWHGEPVRVLSKPGRLFPTWELWAHPSLLTALSSALEDLGVTRVDPPVLDAMRMLEGTPRFGVDIRDRELPQETGQIEALHFSKGCYLGQEIVERIRSRGNVHRVFSGFLLTGPPPSPGTALEAAGKAVGELTSVARFPSLPGFPAGLTFGLGYIRREAVELGHAISFPGGTAQPVSLPVNLNPSLRIATPTHPTHEVA